MSGWKARAAMGLEGVVVKDKEDVAQPEVQARQALLCCKGTDLWSWTTNGRLFQQVVRERGICQA